jgi:hypothetical protein
MENRIKEQMSSQDVLVQRASGGPISADRKSGAGVYRVCLSNQKQLVASPGRSLLPGSAGDGSAVKAFSIFLMRKCG